MRTYHVLFTYTYLEGVVILNETQESNEKLCNVVILLLILQSLEQGHLGI